MARLQPTPTTVKRVFALSGNACAFPDCKQNIVNNNGDLVYWSIQSVQKSIR